MSVVTDPAVTGSSCTTYTTPIFGFMVFSTGINKQSAAGSVKILFNGGTHDKEKIQTGGMIVDNVTNSRITVPVDGVYEITGQLSWSTTTSAAGDGVVPNVYVNGSIYSQAWYWAGLAFGQNNGEEMGRNTKFVFTLTAGQYLELYITDSNSTLDIHAGGLFVKLLYAT
jgi:hypothetical protein